MKVMKHKMKNSPKGWKPSEKKVSIQMDEIVKRDDTFYRKFSNIPFSGHIESYHPNGQLKIIGDLSDGKKWATGLNII